MGGSKTTKFLEYEVSLLKRKFRCRPRRLGSREPRQSLKCSSSRKWSFLGFGPQGKNGLLPRLSLNIRYSSPGTPNNWLLAKGCRAALPSTSPWSKLCSAGMLATTDSRCRFTGETIFLYLNLASEGSHGLFPFCLAKSKSFFFKRKALEAGLLSSLANVTNALPVFWVFKNFLDLGTWLLIWLGDRTINSPGF